MSMIIKSNLQFSGAITDCIFQRNVMCDEMHCEKCGWNPDVDAKRKEETRKRFAKEASE